MYFIQLLCFLSQLLLVSYWESDEEEGTPRCLSGMLSRGAGMQVVGKKLWALVMLVGGVDEDVVQIQSRMSFQ